VFTTFQEAVDFWQDTPEVHTTIYQEFKKNVNADQTLKQHRDFVVYHQFGYGNRPFHWMWNLICAEMPIHFRFLEIGVYQGQVISLMSLLNQRYGKRGVIFGLTPLAAVNDKFSKHHEVDYEERIAMLYHQFGLDASDLQIIQGLSTDKDVVRQADLNAPYNVVYIDGGHDYDTVISDIAFYSQMVAVGGYLVMDDSANYLNIPDGLIRMNWRGIQEVSDAVRAQLESNDQFEHIFSVAHNRVWKRVK
jgi:hypothetical protein